MAKLSKKVADIQMLHSGVVSLNVLENIDRDGKSILKEIVDEIRMGQGRTTEEAPQVLGTVPRVETPPTSGHRDVQPSGALGLAPVQGQTLWATTSRRSWEIRIPKLLDLELSFRLTPIN